MASAQRYVLVTGCSVGGMGWYVAREFAKRGCTVFATLRTVSNAGDLEKTPGVDILPLDVTSPESITACVKAIEAKTGGKLHYLYNNSGAQHIMPLADQSLDAARAMFEVNVWGLLAVTQAFLPMLVAAKGTVVNAGSIRAAVLQPYDGIYGASKAAVTMLSQNMRIEFAPLGVKVLNVHIGGVKTHIFDKQPTNSNFELPEGSYYKPIESTIASFAKGDMIPAGVMPPEDFAKKTVGDVLGGKTNETWRGAFATMVRYMRIFLPTWALDSIALGQSGFDKLAKERAATEKPGR